MFAVYIEVDPGDADGAQREGMRTTLNQVVVPRIRDAGARAGYWLDGSRAVMVFDSEEAAREVAGRMKVGETPPGAPEVYKVRAVEVSEVVASL